MTQDTAGQRMGKLISKAWADEKFKQRLMKNPASVLKEEGVEVQPGVQVRVVEQTEELVYLVIPKAPRTRFSDDQLLDIATNRFRATTQHCDTDCKSIGGTI
jgi:hypothetical protein